DYDTEYCYVAFVKTSEGETFYGEPQSFRTSPVDPDGIKSIENGKLIIENDVYDLNGRKLDKPQKGINIIRYSDGTTRKVLIK
ncbi:MAG: leucine-rich repeat domain-containing protein, partial [Bacteroidaceae bacterium]|nr:leucine-rich repeat domain-containing protein [Bacteroidaceae bacterium]